MIIICGRTIEECENDLAMAKQAMATGMPMGFGGATLEDAEQAFAALKRTIGGYTAIPEEEIELDYPLTALLDRIYG